MSPRRDMIGELGPRVFAQYRRYLGEMFAVRAFLFGAEDRQLSERHNDGQLTEFATHESHSPTAFFADGDSSSRCAASRRHASNSRIVRRGTPALTRTLATAVTRTSAAGGGTA